MTIAKRAPKGERAELGRIRARFLNTLDEDRDWTAARVAYYRGDPQTALGLFRKDNDRRYPDVGSALCLAALGQDAQSEALFRTMGFWCEGGSLEGHVLAAHVWLADYPTSFDEYIPLRVGGAIAQGERAARFATAAKAASKPMRLSMLASLAVAQGRIAVAHKQVKAGLRSALAADIALAVGDLETAKAIYDAYRKSTASSWYTPRGDATKAIGLAGCAAVAYAEGQYTRAMNFAAKALVLDPDRCSTTHHRALLVSFASAATLDLPSAAKTLTKLHRAAPLANVQFGSLALDEIEQEHELVHAPRRAADEGDEAWGEDRTQAIACYEKALRLGRKVRQSIQLGGRRDLIAARLLLGLCESGQEDRADAIAAACMRGAPDFLNALETRAWCATRRRDTKTARSMFAAAGLGVELDSGTHGRRLTLAQWSRLPLERALRAQPASRSAHGRILVEMGHAQASVELFDAYQEVLPNSAEDRFFGAYVRWTAVRNAEGCPTGRRASAKQRREAKRAWAMLEPLIKTRWNVFYQKQPFDPWVLAVELLHALRQWDRLIEVAEKAAEHWSSRWYRPVNVGLAPYVADALVHRGVEVAIAHLEASLIEGPKDLRLLQSLDVICRRGRRPRPAERLKRACPNPEARARELAFEAWRAEKSGDIENALSLYRQSCLLVLDPMALSNAANLLAQHGAFKRADTYWNAALVACGHVSPRRRLSGFLGKLAWQRWLEHKPADVVALASHALELHPDQGIAHTLALAFRALGDEPRASRAIREGLELDSRHRDLRSF